MLEILQLISFHDHHLVAADDRIMGHLIALYSCHPSWESGRLTQHWAVRDPEPVDIITLGCCLVYVRMASSKLTMCICVLYSVTWCTACPLRYQMLNLLPTGRGWVDLGAGVAVCLHEEPEPHSPVIQLIVSSLCWLLKVGDDVIWVLLLLTVKVQTLTELVLDQISN